MAAKTVLPRLDDIRDAIAAIDDDVRDISFAAYLTDR